MCFFPYFVCTCCACECVCTRVGVFVCLTGVAAASGKVGAIIGIATFLHIRSTYGMSAVMLFWAFLAAVGALVTMLFITETNGIDLVEQDRIFEQQYHQQQLQRDTQTSANDTTPTGF